MIATRVDSRRNPDGSIDLRFTDGMETDEVTVAKSAAHQVLLAALFTADPEMIPEHDGFRIAHSQGRPALQFRFGESQWLSVGLGPRDMEVLRDVLKAGFN